MKNTLRTALVCLLTGPCAIAAYAGDLEKDLDGNVYTRGLQPGDPPSLPCPNPGGEVALVLYFFQDGTMKFSKPCPGTSEDPPAPIPPVIDSLSVDYMSDSTDPCYRFKSGGNYYWRCY
jgi:hypothetical protein